MQTTQNPYGDYLLCLDLDHASLMNQPEDYWYEEDETAAAADEKEEEDDYYDETEVDTVGDTGDDGSHHGTPKVTTVRKPQVANAGQLTQERNDTGILYALRDIQAGEELVINYGEFVEPEGWPVLGFSMDYEWDEDEEEDTEVKNSVNSNTDYDYGNYDYGDDDYGND